MIVLSVLWDIFNCNGFGQGRKLSKMAKSEGKQFEEQLIDSCESLGIFHDRIKDVFIPNNIRELLAKHKLFMPTSKNKYDFYLFDNGHLFALELKSINAKSISIKDPKIIKPHQVESLEKASKHEKVIAGFIINFRATDDNETYFVPIQDYLKYRDIAMNGKEHTYKSKVNASSLPVGICKEIGIEIKNFKKKVNYHYHVKDFTSEAIKQYE